MDIGAEIITEEFQRLEAHGVSISSVVDIIQGQHVHPFLHEIVDGPIDVDKLDYLLRDSHHVGLRYHFDLDHDPVDHRFQIPSPPQCEHGVAGNGSGGRICGFLGDWRWSADAAGLGFKEMDRLRP